MSITPIQKRYREMVKHQNFNKIFGFDKSGTDMRDIIVNFRTEIRKQDTRDSRDYFQEIYTELLEFNCRIGRQYPQYPRSNKDDVPELIHDVIDSIKTGRKEYEYLNSFWLSDPHYRYRHRYCHSNDDLVKDLIPSLLLYYGKRRFNEIINAANLTKYFTKSGTFRETFRYFTLEALGIYEFIFRYCNEVRQRAYRS